MVGNRTVVCKVRGLQASGLVVRGTCARAKIGLKRPLQKGIIKVTGGSRFSLLIARVDGRLIRIDERSIEPADLAH